jgi:hypothetical protein
MHYYAKTTYRSNYFYWLLFALSILASIVYFVVRIIYIAQGRSALKVPLNLTVKDFTKNPVREVRVSELLPDIGIGDELTDSLLNQPELADLKGIVGDETYSFWWSCCVLAAEIGGFILVHVSQQMFIRQDTKFYPLPPEHVQNLRDVRSCCCSSSLLRASLSSPCDRPVMDLLQILVARTIHLYDRSVVEASEVGLSHEGVSWQLALWRMALCSCEPH